MLDLKTMAGEDCIIVMPDDVHLRHEWLSAFERMGVRVFSESSFVQMLSGYLPLDGVTHRELTRLRSKGRRIPTPRLRILFTRSLVSWGMRPPMQIV